MTALPPFGLGDALGSAQPAQDVRGMVSTTVLLRPGGLCPPTPPWATERRRCIWHPACIITPSILCAFRLWQWACGAACTILAGTLAGTVPGSYVACARTSGETSGKIMAEDITHLLVVPHTHWDREWYLTFQQFRVRLVRTVDLVLDTLEADPSFAFFMLDGQTIVLEDYLEVRPEHRERLARLARAGRILVGPWYLQPDEFLVGAESLVRNLQIGRRMGAAFGGVMPVGYVPDTFGHIAQLPQILRGFGLDNAVFWRGVGPEVERGAFRWAAPDGSEVLAIWLFDDFGYSNAAILPLEPEALATRVTQIAERMRPLAVTDVLLLMNGTDHI